jgi:hypothetical protein
MSIEQPFDDLVASVRRFAPIIEQAGVVTTTRVESRVEAAPEPPVDAEPLSDLELRDLDARLGAARSRLPATAPVQASAPPATIASAIPAPALVAASAQPRSDKPKRFFRRGFDVGSSIAGNPAGLSPTLTVLRSIAGSALFVIVPLLFVVPGLQQLGTNVGVGLAFVLLGLVIAGFGVHPLLRAIGRWPLVTGDEEILTVGPSGIAARGLGELAWAQVDQVTVDGGGTLHVYAGSNALLERTWGDRAADAYGRAVMRLLPFRSRGTAIPAYTLQLGLLDADPSAVVDAIARFRPVFEVEAPESSD